MSGKLQFAGHQTGLPQLDASYFVAGVAVVSAVGAALLGFGGLLSAQRPARLDGARRNVREDRPRFWVRPI